MTRRVLKRVRAMAERVPRNAAMSAEQLRRRLDLPDDKLIGECEVFLYKASGPGGQHRNKVTSAVRLRHRGSGLEVTATESRSQHENRARAVRRLREAIALVARVPLPESPTWPETVHLTGGRLRVNEKNPAIHHVIALVLDAVAACAGDVRAAAERLSLTPSNLVRFLHQHRKAWSELARIRQQAGLKPLRPPK